MLERSRCCVKWSRRGPASRGIQQHLAKNKKEKEEREAHVEASLDTSTVEARWNEYTKERIGEMAAPPAATVVPVNFSAKTIAGIVDAAHLAQEEEDGSKKS